MASSPLFQRDSNTMDEPPRSEVASPSGAGSPSTRGSKQTRRLQLRNAGFRGPQVPLARKVTPAKSVPSLSTNTTETTSSWGQASDAENVSPSGKKAKDMGSGSNRRKSSGILQDIGNKRSGAKARVTSGRFWTPHDHDDITSPIEQPQHSSTIRPRSLRTRAKMSKPRRSVSSSETRKYIDHLEQQLEEAQDQLSAMTSPTVTREQSSKMRHMNADLKALQDEVADWEAKYEERVQEEVDRHFQLEASLRSRVRTLEQEAEETQFRLQDMEEQLEGTTENLEAVETANVNLEKRLEIMSELLAASPTKIDLHAATPGRARQGRPQSMLPRFPTAGSLAMSPERQAHTQPTSPLALNTSPSMRYSPGLPISPVNLSFSPDVSSADEDGAGSEASMSTSIIHTSQQTKSKPHRRMRRFGAGSIGPKPLILPSTSHCEQIPVSAPPFESVDGESAFPFPPPDTLLEEADGSPRSVRRRASTETEADAMPASRLSSWDDGARYNEMTLNALVGGSSPAMMNSEGDTRNFSADTMGSTLGASVGRNLMDELTAVKSCGTDPSSDPIQEQTVENHAIGEPIPASSPFNSDVEEEPPTNEIPDINIDDDHNHPVPPDATGSRFASSSSTAVAPSTAIGTLRKPPDLPTLHSRSSSRSLSTTSSHASLSTLDSLRTIFSDLFRSPIDVVKHLVQAAQNRMGIPRPLLSIQWWLVGVLLGPMAKRRMLQAQRQSSPEQQALLPDSPNQNEDGALCYSTAYATPLSSPNTGNRARSLVAGKGKKRASSVSLSRKNAAGLTAAGVCEHQRKRWKHSPWLWLKFSMCLAVAVGVAFKDGPSSLLKEAVCQCCRKAGGKGAGGNWRRARRDEVSVSPRSV